MIWRFGSSRAAAADLVRVEDLVRDRFAVAAEDLVLVSEDRGAKPGYPDHETNLVFWKGSSRYRIKLFKRLAEVDATDLPVRWLLPVYEDNGDNDCC